MQFSGINGVLYYTPQILEQAGVGYLLSNLGLSSTSSSFLISAVTTLLMLPCIAVAMRLMDISGRRYPFPLYHFLLTFVAHMVRNMLLMFSLQNVICLYFFFISTRFSRISD
jgi:MFS family permease